MYKTIKRDKGSFYNFIETVKSKEKNNVNNSNIFINDFSCASNDVYHIDNNSLSLSEIVLPKSIEYEIKNIVFEHNDKDFFEKLGFIPSNKLMLYGNPGCGKTKLAYIISNLLGRDLKIVNLSKLVSAHLGETNNNISSIFSKYGSKDYILFIDEFDIIGRLRGDSNNDHNEMKRIVNTLLQLMDFLPKDAFVVFATNDIDVIDKAFIRRLDIILEIPLPNKVLIKKYLKYKFSKYNEFISDLDYTKLTNKFIGYSYSEIEKSIEKTLKNIFIDFRKSKQKNVPKINTEIFINNIL